MQAWMSLQSGLSGALTSKPAVLPFSLSKQRRQATGASTAKPCSKHSDLSICQVFCHPWTCHCQSYDAVASDVCHEHCITAASQSGFPLKLRFPLHKLTAVKSSVSLYALRMLLFALLQFQFSRFVTAPCLPSVGSYVE